MDVFRRLSNPFQNWERRRSATDDDLAPRTKDDVFRWHVGSADFARLDEDSFLRAGICGNKQMAEKVLKACHKTGIIDAQTGCPNTAKVDRNVTSAMPFISMLKQKELVMLLFFWEEEITRWRLLGQEESEMKKRLRRNGLSQGDQIELKEALQVVQARRRVLPSLRDQSGRVVVNSEEQLPSYEDVRRERHA